MYKTQHTDIPDLFMLIDFEKAFDDISCSFNAKDLFKF